MDYPRRVWYDEENLNLALGGTIVNVISLLTPKAGVAYLYEDFTIRQGLEKLRHYGYTAIPVLARDGQYVGTVSEGDFLWCLLDEENNSLRDKEKLPLRHVLRPAFNPAVRVDVTLEELLDRSLQQSFIPVVDDRGAFVGIVTRQNIIRKLTVLKTQDGPGQETRHFAAAR